MSELQLTEDQEKASVAFTDFLIDKDKKYMVIQGAAGTGKSTLVKYLLRTMDARMKLYSVLLGQKGAEEDFTIELTATTNKAAAVLAELTDDTTCTIYSRLGLRMNQNYNTGEVTFTRTGKSELIHNALLVVDEASFINSSLSQDIEKGTVNCKILLIGDQYQLAPVKQKVPVMDSIDCTKVSLDKIMRHGGAIAAAGALYREAVKTGTFTDIIPNEQDIIHVDGPTFQKMIDAEFLKPDYDESKARILAWTNFAVQRYNGYIRGILGFPDQLGEEDTLITNKAVIGKFGVMATTDSSVKITDVGETTERYGIPGRMVSVNHSPQYFLADNQLAVKELLSNLAKQAKQTRNWVNYFSVQNDWLDLRPVYASTVHKAQGSTYDTVFINLTDIGKCHIASDVARMMYVAITRAAKKVVLYGALPPKYRGSA